MITRPRVRRAACWVGVLIGLAALAGYASCLRRPMVAGSTERAVVLGRGTVSFYWAATVPGAWTPGMYIGLDPGAGGPGWWRWLPKWVEPTPPKTSAQSYTMGEFTVPLWMPAALGLLCLYWLLPERGPWHLCEKCGYDLRAVPRKDGRLICPECGESRP